MYSPVTRLCAVHLSAVVGLTAGTLSLLVLAAVAVGSGTSQAAPPATSRDSVVDVLHGVRVADPYRWLEDQNSSQTRAWIDAEDKYTHSLIDGLAGREKLKARLTELMKVDSTGMPVERHGRYFFMRRRADQNLYVLYVRQGLHGQDEVLIDPHPLSADHSTSVSMFDVSRDGALVAYQVRQGGQDETTVHFFDVDHRKELADPLPKAFYFAGSITPDKTGMYYSLLTADGPRVRYHRMNADAASDTEIFGKGYGRDKIIINDLSEEGRYLVITVLHGSAADQTEVYFQDLATRGPITPVVHDIPARFFGSVGGDHLFLQTNWKAPNQRVISVDLKNPGREHWREIIPESKDVIQDQGVSLAGGKVFVPYLHDVTSRLSVFDAEGRHQADIALPALGSVDQVQGNWDGKDAFYGFTSFVIPYMTYRYDIGDGSSSVWAKTNVPIASDRFQVEQVWYSSKDGTRVPMFLVHSKNLRRDGKNPVLMTAYGGFDVSLTPYFSAEAAAWVESGGVFALPNLRGGGEFGEAWHKAGMRANKQNVFDDFVAAAEWLIRNRYTEPVKLAITGQSNGGLLVGAALTQRPDLYRAVVCRYPLLDMLRYQDFLVARFWVPEYGSSADAEQFKYILKYSPYQNVKKGVKYPATLFVSGDGDTRVAPLHARKMAAMLQWATGSDHPVLLDYDTKSGHSGGRPLSKQIDELTDEMSFLFWQLGVQVH